MSLDIGKKCIDFLLKEAREADVNTLPNKKRQIDISFWGGEPLLEWKLLQDLVLYTQEKKRPDVMASYGGTTNGVLLTEEKFPFMKEHAVLFMVSLDGTQETHDKYRRMANGNGSHAVIMRNMEKVLKYWPFYKVRMSPYAEGIHRFYEDVKYLVEFGFTNIMFSPVYESGFKEEHWKIWEAECYKVVDLIADYRKKGVKVEIEHFKSYMNKDRSEWPCLTGDTEISLLNGTEIPIKDLVGETNFYVYSCKENGEIIPGKVNRVWKTGNKQVIKITLDNGKSFKCTEDHRLMLRNGEYAQAKDCLNKSLMPLYVNKQQNHKVVSIELCGNEDVYDMEVQNVHNFALTSGVFVHNCGAGRFYVGFDTDGAIYPCHRFNKFTDQRNWKEKEVCIGHVDYGITNSKFREMFIDWHPIGCDTCNFAYTTPCHGGCFTGDTKIPLLSGENKELKDLEGNSNFWVYSCNENGNIVPGKVTKVWKTGINKPVFKITLDNGKIFRCTENHRFLLRNNEYLCAKKSIGQSIMPLYTRLSKGFLTNYLEVYDPGLNNWKLVHSIVSDFFNGKRKSGEIVHHKDFNKYNNSPENLELMPLKTHQKLHSDIFTKTWRSPEGRARKSKELAETNRRLWSDPVYRKVHTQINQERARKAAKLWEDEQYRKIHCKLNSKAGKIGGRKGKGKIPWNKGLKNAQVAWNKGLKGYGLGHPYYGTEETKERARQHLKSLREKRNGYKGKDSPNYRYGRSCRQLLNHKIVSIEFDGYEDVYDMEVEKFHNFAIESGIFVHNCFAVNFDLTGDIRTPHKDLCRYVQMQKAVSEYYKEKIGMEQGLAVTGHLQGRGCICYNMCYLENTKDEIRDVDGSTDVQCMCYNANYTGELNQNLARPLEQKSITPTDVMELLRKVDKRLSSVEEYIVLKEGGKK